ncbi:MAG: 3-oxoacyl-ACP reductase FabG [Deltaproteobacteria bacterium]|nr:3-oxoacyl-ACP reductase FabG [Deltaproteobacteria bacterium]
MRLKDKVAVITGGARGIGKATAELFGKEGAKLILADFDQETGETTVGELKARGIPCVFVRTNVVDAASVAALFARTVEEFGRVDVLVNNAGITADGWLAKMSEDQWDRVIGVNLKGVFLCSQAAVKIMLEQGSGCILNAASVVGIYGNQGQTNYVATKAGVIGMTKGWAKELGPKGIRVNAVAPGFIMTDMMASVPEKVLKMMEEKTPLRRLGQAADIAEAYLFLAADSGSYVTGAVLSVDGGLVT